MSKVVVLGNATVDFVLRMERWPSAGETILADGMTQGPGGKGLNQAVAAARLGAETRFVAPIGRDLNGRSVMEAAAREHGIALQWLLRDLPTDVSTIWTSATGDNMIVSSAECARSVRPEDIGPLSVLDESDILLVQGNLPSDTTVAAARLARRRKSTVVVNTAPIWWDMAELLSLSDVVVGNEPEIGLLANSTDERALEQIRSAGAGAVVMTRGADGAVLKQDGAPEYFAAPKVRVIDTSGAGDMAVGAIVASLLQGLALSDSVRRAMACAALTVTRAGTLTSFPNRDELTKGRAD